MIIFRCLGANVMLVFMIVLEINLMQGLHDVSWLGTLMAEKGGRCLTWKHTIFTSRDMKFYEDLFPLAQIPSPFCGWVPSWLKIGDYGEMKLGF